MSAQVRLPVNGCDRCYCGCKYWEGLRCVDCGGTAVDRTGQVQVFTKLLPSGKLKVTVELGDRSRSKITARSGYTWLVVTFYDGGPELELNIVKASSGLQTAENAYRRMAKFYGAATSHGGAVLLRWTARGYQVERSTWDS